MFQSWYNFMSKINYSSITIGVPFYSKSNPKHFDLAINSIIYQTLLPNKIHLIQDGPINQDLNNIIEKYISKYKDWIKLIVLPKKGLPYALNQSIKITKTKYYARMDADDICLNNRLETQFNYLEKNKKVEILGSWAYEFEKYHNKKNLYINKVPNNIDKMKEYFHYRNPLVHSSVIFRVKVFKKIGLYNETMYTDQDLELWSRALKHNIDISNIQEPLIYFRTMGRLKKRSQFSAIKRQIKIRYSYNTSSFKLNILKLGSIMLRVMPIKVIEWSYKNLRG